MEVEFEDADLEQLAHNQRFDMGLSRPIVKAYRMRVQLIRAAADERAFYALKSLHFEKLKGDLVGKYSMRLNDQWRLLLRFVERENGKSVVVISISDYH
jgi:toxin HigB-1